MIESFILTFPVEDSGAGARFCLFMYNVQPGVEIDYATGERKVKK